MLWAFKTTWKKKKDTKRNLSKKKKEKKNSKILKNKTHLIIPIEKVLAYRIGLPTDKTKSPTARRLEVPNLAGESDTGDSILTSARS